MQIVSYSPKKGLKDWRECEKSSINPRENPQAHSNFTVGQPWAFAGLSGICVLVFIGNRSSCVNIQNSIHWNVIVLKKKYKIAG